MTDHDRTIRTAESGHATTPDGARTSDGSRTTEPRRTPDERLADHARIGRLAEELLPELASRLAAGNLGEIEIREDGWRLRVRRPAGAAALSTRRSGERTRSGAGHAAQSGHGTAGTAGAATSAAEPPHGSSPRDPHRIVATSPAVGIFHVRPELHAGSRVRSGERIAMVDLLGVPQDVVAPEDGVIVETLADNGDGVEYGQDLVVIELVGRFGPSRAGAGHDGSEVAAIAGSNGTGPSAVEPA